MYNKHLGNLLKLGHHRYFVPSETCVFNVTTNNTLSCGAAFTLKQNLSFEIIT